MQIPKSLKYITTPKTGHIGKWMASALYVHVAAIDVLPNEKLRAAQAKLPPGFDHQVVKWEPKSGKFTFVRVKDFVNEPEPTVLESITISPNGKLHHRKYKTNPPIYHHKWAMVDPASTWLDQDASIQRSHRIEELNLKPDVKRRMGFKNFWEKDVIPLLGEA